MSKIEVLVSATHFPVSKEQAETFLYHEAALLDQRRFEEWETLFAEDGYYWVPSRLDQRDPLTEVSIFYDDRVLMRTRIQRLRHPRIHVQDPPSRTCHFISNVQVEVGETADDPIIVRSSLLVHEYRLGEQKSFAGQCTHALRRVGGNLRIAWKRVDLINAEGVFDPIAIFF